MKNYNVLEINLEDSPSSEMTVRSGGATYEEAFLGGGSEEMSNARGRGRARRQARKLDRTAKRRERKVAKVEAKDDVRSVRAESRLSRRGKRKGTRQEMRDAQMEARQGRRSKRMEMKESRKGSPESEEEEELEETTLDREDTGSKPMSSSSQDEYSDEDEDAGYDKEDDKGEGYYSDDVDAGQDDAGYDDDSSYNQYPTFEEEDNFDGETSSFVSEVTGRKQVPEPVQKICLKIEWNNEMLERLSRQKRKMQVDGSDTSRVDNAIDQKFERNQELEKNLEQFIGADGSKAKVVSQAKRQARKERLTKVIPQGVLKQMQKRGLTKQQIKEWWQSKGSKKFSSMSGEAGWDGYPDVVYVDKSVEDAMQYGVPSFDFDTNLGEGAGFDPMSFATGEQSGNKNIVRPLIIGLLITGVTIYFIRKYKLLN